MAPDVRRVAPFESRYCLLLLAFEVAVFLPWYQVAGSDGPYSWSGEVGGFAHFYLWLAFLATLVPLFAVVTRMLVAETEFLKVLTGRGLVERIATFDLFFVLVALLDRPGGGDPAYGIALAFVASLAAAAPLLARWMASRRRPDASTVEVEGKEG